MSEVANNRLHLIELNGDRVAGTTTAARKLQEAYPDIVVDDVSEDIPALALYLLEQKPTLVDMPQRHLESHIASLGAGFLRSVINGKANILEKNGIVAFEESDEAQEVADRLWECSDVGVARQLSFRQRTEHMRNQGVGLMACLHADIARFGAPVHGASVLQRMHFTCDPVEASWRLVENNGLSITDAAGVRMFKEIAVQLRRAALDKSNTRHSRPSLPSEHVPLWRQPWPVAETVALMEREGADIDALGLRSRAYPQEVSEVDIDLNYSATEVALKALLHSCPIAIDTAAFRTSGPEREAQTAAMGQVVVNLFAAVNQSRLVE